MKKKWVFHNVDYITKAFDDTNIICTISRLFNWIFIRLAPLLIFYSFAYGIAYVFSSFAHGIAYLFFSLAHGIACFEASVFAQLIPCNQ